jgi:hypothetical protein
MAVACLLTLALAAAWEIRSRALGYRPSLNDTPDLWALRRNAVRPDSIVIIGDSRAWFDLDLDEIERGLGSRPVQLAIPGSCAYPVLANLADDPSFHGTVVCSLLPAIFMAPAGAPVENSMKAINRWRTQTVSQRASNELGMFLEEHIAFMKEDDLTLGALLGRLPIPNRPGALIPPRLPPYFESVDRERRARMFELCAVPGPLQERVRQGWPALFTPPPPPTYVPIGAFLKGVGAAIEARFRDTASAVRRIQARGGKVVFVRLPVSGDLKVLEDHATPRVGTWNRFIRESGAPGIYFEDYPELSGFVCPEWSHLSAPDSVEFTRRLVPHLVEALGAGGKGAAEAKTPSA